MNGLRALVLVLLLAIPGVALAQPPSDVRIDISGGAQRIPIRCEAIQSAGDKEAQAWALQAQEVLAHDLDWSAVFTVSRAWVSGESGADAQAVVGGMLTLKRDEIVLAGQVKDVPAGRPIMAHEYRGKLSEWRDVVHRFADDIVLQFTGEPGVSRTHIVFAAQKGKNKELYVMDYDGANLRALTQDNSIAMSPAYSSDGALILFTSYRGGAGPRVFVIRSSGGKPYLISGRPGINTSAVYAPDGRDIACTLSMDGNSEIYLLDAKGASPRRLTNQRSIDTSPAWAPTGQEIAFTSDRGGSPQVYVMDREGGNVRRLTFEIDYTDSPAWSPKGDRLAFVARTSAGFDVYTCRANGSEARLVAGGGFNENPHWSPDGRHLVFSSDRDGHRGLFVSDLDGKSPRRLETGGLIASSPAWSPQPAGANAQGNAYQNSSVLGGKP